MLNDAGWKGRDSVATPQDVGTGAQADLSLPRRLFDAIERADLQAVHDLYAEDVQVWNNVALQPMARAQSLKLLKLFIARTKGIRYEVLEVLPFPGGCVDRHVLRGSTLGGETFETHVCIVLHIRDGRIWRLYEYLDQASVGKVFSA